MSNRKRIVALAIAALGTCIAAPASATLFTQVTQETALGACIPSGPTGFVPGYASSLLYNASATKAMYLDCSLPIASADASDTLQNGAQLALFGTNQSSSEPLVCNFTVVSPFGLVLASFTPKSLAPGVSGALAYNYAGLHLSAPAYGSCQIPKAQGSAISGLLSARFIYTVSQ